jgi:hypothetical protein
VTLAKLDWRQEHPRFCQRLGSARASSANGIKAVSHVSVQAHLGGRVAFVSVE